MKTRKSGTADLFAVLDKGATCKAMGEAIHAELPKLSSQETGDVSKVDWKGPTGRQFAFNYLPWKVRATGTPKGVAVVDAKFRSSNSPGQIWVSRVSKWGDDRIGPTSSPLERHINFSFQKNGGYKSSSVLGPYTTAGDVYVLACAYELEPGGKKAYLQREMGGVLRSRGDMRTGFSALLGDDLNKTSEYVLAVAAWVEPANSLVTSNMARTGALSVQIVVNHNGR